MLIEGFCGENDLFWEPKRSVHFRTWAPEAQKMIICRPKNEELSRLLFPLAEVAKKDIKVFAEEKNIGHKTGESQDICFLNIVQLLHIFFQKIL